MAEWKGVDSHQGLGPLVSGGGGGGEVNTSLRLHTNYKTVTCAALLNLSFIVGC